MYLRGALAKHLISCCFDPGSVRDVGAVYQLDVAEAGEGRGGWRKGAVCVWGGGREIQDRGLMGGGEGGGGGHSWKLEVACMCCVCGRQP